MDLSVKFKNNTALVMNTQLLKAMLFSLLGTCSDVALAFPISIKMKNLHLNSSTSLTSEPQVWSPFRFFKQSSKFVPLPFTPSKDRMVGPGEMLWKPGDSKNDCRFAPLDDVVMGGVSMSNFDDVTGNWCGTVTDANNGGFIGVRSYPSVKWDMSNCQGIRVRLQSMAKTRIKIGLRDTNEFNGIVWCRSTDVFKIQEVKIPFSTLVPTKFAKCIEQTKTFDQSNVVGIQLVYSKFEYDGKLNPKFQKGDFNLQVLEISSY